MSAPIQQQLLSDPSGRVIAAPTFVKNQVITSVSSVTGIAADDLVILCAVSDGTAAPALDPGTWKRVDTDGTVALPSYSWWYTFSLGTSVLVDAYSASVAYIAYVFRGVSKQVPFTSMQISSGLSATLTPPVATTATTNELVVLLGFLDDDNVADTNNLAAPATFTLAGAVDRGADGASNTGATAMAAYKIQATPGTVTPGSFTSTSMNDDWKAYTLTLPSKDYSFDSSNATGVASQQTFTTPGTTTWTVPNDVYQIHVFLVGGGGGGAGSDGGRNEGNAGGSGGSAYRATINVVPGMRLSVTVGAGGAAGGTDANGGNGGASRISIVGGYITILEAGGGVGGLTRSTANTPQGSGSAYLFFNGYYVDFSGALYLGGVGGGGLGNNCGGGGGGAGGYRWDGGAGGANGAGLGGGDGGGGGGSTTLGQGYSGGGVGLLGAGTFSTGGALNQNGSGGSGGGSGSQTSGGLYGGGGGARDDDSAGAGCAGGQGAVRIMWGTGRSYPDNAADV